MSKIENLKKQYPHLNVTLMDLLCSIDTTKTKKYLSLLCKIFGSKFTFEGRYPKSEIENELSEMKERFARRKINIENLTNNQILTYYYFLDYFNSSDFELFQEFMDNCENKRLDNLDVLTYNTLDEIMRANSLCSLKLEEKNMEGQVLKEYEDDDWVMVRPLTFSSSSKYGAGTKWCTTMSDEKSYFHKYWSKGILIYFINKKTGYKFAAYRNLIDDDDFSFWSAEDKRVDFFSLELDDYLYPIIKKIFKSEKTNKEFCSDELASKVYSECVELFNRLDILEYPPGPIAIEIPANGNNSNITTTYDGDLEDGLTITYQNPTMRA